MRKSFDERRWKNTTTILMMILTCQLEPALSAEAMVTVRMRCVKKEMATEAGALHQLRRLDEKLQRLCRAELLTTVPWAVQEEALAWHIRKALHRLKVLLPILGPVSR